MPDARLQRVRESYCQTVTEGAWSFLGALALHDPKRWAWDAAQRCWWSMDCQCCVLKDLDNVHEYRSPTAN